MKKFKPSISEYNKRINNSITVEAKINKAINETDKRIKEQDEKYASIVSIIMNELNKRDINIADPEFNNKINEIIIMLCQTPFFSRKFKSKEDTEIDSDIIKEIRNAVKRRLNFSRGITDVGDEQR